MALNSEIHADVSTIDEEEREEEEWRKWEEAIKKLEEELWSKKERKHWKLLQLTPTVYSINKVNWMRFGLLYWDVRMSLGMSPKVLEEAYRRATLHYNKTQDWIISILTKWLNHENGTGNKKRTWGTICTAIANEYSYSAAFSILEQVIDIEGMYAQILSKKPTLQEIEELILHSLGEDWERVGQLLQFSPRVMKEIGSKFGHVPTQCSEAMFSKWLNHEEGTGHKERTWGTVLTALEDAGRGDLAIAVLDKLTVKHKEEEALKKAPNIKEIEVLVIPHVAYMWWAIGRLLGIIKAILTAIESEAWKKVSLKQTCEMFQLWLDGSEGTGDEDRSWFVILRVLVNIGRSPIIYEIQGHFDLTTKDIARALSLLPANTESFLYDSFPPTSSNPVLPTTTSVPTTSQDIADTASLASPPLTNNAGQVSLHDRNSEVDGGLEEDKESTPTHHPPQSNGDHFTWSEPKRRHLEEGLDKKGRFPSDQSARSRRRQKLKKLNRFPKRLGLDRRQKCSVTFDPCGKSKRRKKKNRRCLSEKSGHSREHPPDQPGFSGRKRSPPSGDLEESGHKTRSYSNVSVEFVIRKITRRKFRDAIKRMLDEQRIRLLYDDWKLINEKCKNIILGLLDKKNDVEAADQLIEYFKDTHTGEELLIFRDFLREEAEDDGRNQQLLNLAKSIEDAVYSASP